ncbi:hypothetical protein ACFC1B_06970 [Streptomyces xiamenensis]|uniref:hypothetical protein n=1 Tax=Streptomyces xiamenensis TaxID=408015 RepID=UPI0035D7E398
MTDNRRWDVYSDRELDEQLAKRDGPPWDALRKIVAALEWRADAVGEPLPYPWPTEIRRAYIEDDDEVYGQVEFLVESPARRICRILDVTWAPDVDV